jgi:hypothetical protein
MLIRMVWPNGLRKPRSYLTLAGETECSAVLSRQEALAGTSSSQLRVTGVVVTLWAALPLHPNCARLGRSEIADGLLQGTKSAESGAHGTFGFEQSCDPRHRGLVTSPRLLQDWHRRGRWLTWNYIQASGRSPDLRIGTLSKIAEERVHRMRFESPIVRHAFESAITKIKEKVASTWAVTDCHPIGWLISERIRSYYLIEFTPFRRKITVAALAAIPPSSFVPPSR